MRRSVAPLYDRHNGTTVHGCAELTRAALSRCPALSERLVALDLSRLDGPALAAAIRDEALRLAGAERAILWRYRPGLGRLFSEQVGEDLRAIEVTAPETRDILRKLSLWPPQVVGVRQRLVDASFGVASGEPAPTFAVPLRVGPAPVGLLLVRLRDWGRAGALPGRLAAFAAQAAALLFLGQQRPALLRHPAAPLSQADDLGLVGVHQALLLAPESLAARRRSRG